MKFQFNLTLIATATVEAESEEDAREKLDADIGKYKVGTERLDTNKDVKISDFDEFEVSEEVS